MNSWPQQNTEQTSHGLFPEKDSPFDLKALQTKDASEVVLKLNENIAQLKLIIRSEERQHNSDEFISDLVCTLALACRAPQREKTGNILATLKGSSLLRTKIPHLLYCFQAKHSHDLGEKLIESLIGLFRRYLKHLPSSYADLPYDQLKRALDESDLKGNEKLKKDLDSFKQDRDCVIKGERQRLNKRYVNRAGEEPPIDFRNIPICPTRHEIVSQETPFLRTNITKGRYENAEHYLDVQFRLLREDFLGPLREGIQEIIQDIPKQQRNQFGMKNYRSVKIVTEQFETSGIVHHVQIDVTGLNTSKWIHSRLVYGSFLCLSQDKFKTMLFATVVERDEDKLKDGRIGIQFTENQDVFGIENGDCAYQMVESPAYFEAYRHVLKGLQELDDSTLPFKKYLVECSKEVDPPKYLRRDDSEKPICYDLSKALNISSHHKTTEVPVLQPKEWPPAKALPLNSSQLEALRTAITTEFCVIQGPPGTGKTYVGTIIVRCLLENRNIWDPQHNSPMLMVCYTNHALDQFLEKVLEFLPSQEIIRVGTRSKSEKLESCNLKQSTGRSVRLIVKQVDIRKRRKQHKREIEYWSKSLSKAETLAKMIEFDDLEEMMNSAHADQFYNVRFPHFVADKSRSAENTFRLWLCNDQLINSYNKSVQDEVNSENGQYIVEEIPSYCGANEVINAISKENCVFFPEEQDEANGDNILSAKGEIRDDSHADESVHFISQKDCEFPLYGQDQEEEKDDDAGEWHLVENRKRHFNRTNEKTQSFSRRKDFIGNKDRRNSEERTADISTLLKPLKKEEMMTTEEVMLVENIWDLEKSDRLRLYLCWIKNYCDYCKLEVHRSRQEYQQLCTEQEQVKFEREEEVIRRATVVGMTTTCAAKYHSVLQNVAPKIVVIEEAAEVMEAHILTSLTHKTEHAILIGDHKQLRPKAAVYELAQEHHLEVSLFERMVMNNMDCKRLSVQHRMRPEIAALTKRIYDHEIIDHESVRDFDNIHGVCHNLFFIEHNHPERMVGGLQSYANDHEAKFIVALCEYLLLQGYKQSQITVLTMYIGQLLRLKELMPRDTCREVRICAVDNFQGEENDIILLSLVRSNEENRIGFLEESNRICVALSRARKGLYCIGNFSLLKRKSDLWKDICNQLEKTKGIANNLQLICKKHKNVTVVRRADDFNPFGGCNIPCGIRRQCGHACDQPCHASDDHWFTCRKPCPRKCPREHVCLEKCHHPKKCPPCSHLMTKTVPKCNHEQLVPCSVDPEKFSCRRRCQKMLSCGHQCGNNCGENCSSKCQVSVIKSLLCGHEGKLPCFRDPTTFTNCQKACRKILDCKHPCSKKCSEQCRCEMKITVTLPCGHTKEILCREKKHSITCKEKCKQKLGCGHDCTGLCHEDCKVKECKFEVCKELPCGHQQTLPCYQKSENVFCYAPCPRHLECGHKCPSVCGEPCQEVKCEEMCLRKCKKGHPCKRRCHDGSPCGDCTQEVNMTIPSCGHTIKRPCYIDPSTEECQQPCDRVRSCGHPCEEICSRDCETKPCVVRVQSTLPCNHLEFLPCHENPEEVACNKIVQVLLACEHEASIECHVTKDGLRSVLCKKLIEKELPCKHKLVIPCFQNPEDYFCSEKVSVELPCGHEKSIPCADVTAGLPDQICTVKEERTLPCGHKATLSCDTKPEEHCCNQMVEVTLSCGHNKRIMCSETLKELQDEICDTPVERKLLCGHKYVVQCSLDVDEIRCNNQCERLLPCGHKCSKKCGEVCTQFRCMEKVQKNLNCGYHKISCHCSDDVSKLNCTEKCREQLECGHPCPGKCSDDCSQHRCKTMVVKNLSCPGNHSQRMACYKDPKSVKCRERCKKDLDCGHKCPRYCSEPCENVVCQEEVQKTYDCGHQGKVKCFKFKEATCQAPCERQQKCGHVCGGICGNPCSNYPCKYIVTMTLLCNHKIKIPCSSSTNNVRCRDQCLEKLPCGHRCPGKCTECCERGSHEFCQSQCNRKLVCSHRCRAKCGMPCPPCSRKCGSRCPHVKCFKSCSELCSPCKRPCKWNCNHYQCTRTCQEECDRPRCDAPCPKKLPCNHPCIGLCGEDCPTLCAICDSKELSSMLSEGRAVSTEATRYIQLHNCRHILPVDEMDAMMQQDLGSNVQLMRCPRCSTPITFSFRYGNQVKKTLKNLENVKKEIYNLGDETGKLVKKLYNALPDRRQGIVTTEQNLALIKLVERGKIRPLDVPSLCRFKNQLLVIREFGKAQLSLKRIRPQVSLGVHSQINRVLKTVMHEFEDITRSLESCHPYLRSLGEAYDETRKYGLFASLLELHSEAAKRDTSLSTKTTSLLNKVTNDPILFLQGKDDILIITELESLANQLGMEVHLEPSIETPAELQSFPGVGQDVWKLCEHTEVCFTRTVWRKGQEEIESSNRCAQCAA